MSSNNESQGWPFSDEAAARDAGLIPPDLFSDPSPRPSTDGDVPAAPPEDFVAAISDTVDADAFNESQDPEDASTRNGETEDHVVSPSADHPIDMDDVPSQSATTRASDDPGESGYQNDTDPPR